MGAGAQLLGPEAELWELEAPTFTAGASTLELEPLSSGSGGCLTLVSVSETLRDGEKHLLLEEEEGLVVGVSV